MGVKNNIENLMKQNGMNASSLADKAGMPKSTVYALLKRDSSNISYQTAQKLALALECSESDILDFKDTDKSYYEGLKNKIKILTEELNKLESIDDYIEMPVITDTGDLEVVQESIYKSEIDFIELELAKLNFEIENLLKRLNIAQKPYPFSEIINFYMMLNDTGKLEAIKRVEELTQINKYVNK